MTAQPWARKSWTTSCPTTPSPTTTTRSPRVGPASRTPCSAMAPRVAKAASSGAMGVPSGRAGTGTHRVRGTQTTSAWTA